MYVGTFIRNKEEIVVIDDHDIQKTNRTSVVRSNVVVMNNMTTKFDIIHANIDGIKVISINDANYQDLGDFHMWHGHIRALKEAHLITPATLKADITRINLVISLAQKIKEIIDNGGGTTIGNYVSFMEKHLDYFCEADFDSVYDVISKIASYEMIQ